MIAFRVFRLFSQQGDQKALYLASLPNPLLHFQWYPGRSSIARIEQHILIVPAPRAGGRPGCPASVSANTTDNLEFPRHGLSGLPDYSLGKETGRGCSGSGSLVHFAQIAAARVLDNATTRRQC